ncbi:histidine phosphatase family protein, partial [Nocardia cyriacigeorgica]|nr:histidine phosphatase family protein [Nocardia cyriacigeorgica]
MQLILVRHAQPVRIEQVDGAADPGLAENVLEQDIDHPTVRERDHGIG